MDAAEINKKINFSPLVIIVLCLLLLAVSALYIREKNPFNTHHVQAVTRDSNVQSAQQIHWRMVTSWPKNFPGLGMAPERLAEKVKKMSAGRFMIEVFPAGEIVPALGVFDAVSNGTVQAGHSGSYYWKGKIPASVFFTALPFGMNAQEMNAWLYFGGGLDLWQQLYKPYGVIPFPGGNTGVQMAGWFNKRITAISDVKNLRMRTPGLGGEVFSRIGGEPINIPGGEIFTALQTGVIDGSEWIGPYNDRAFGFQDIARYYYYPGWQEPSATLEFIFNSKAFEQLPDDLQAILEVATEAVNHELLNEYTARNPEALRSLNQEKDLLIEALPDDVLLKLYRESQIAIQKIANSDAQAKAIYASYAAFSTSVRQYHRISENAMMHFVEEHILTQP